MNPLKRMSLLWEGFEQGDKYTWGRRVGEPGEENPERRPRRSHQREKKAIRRKT